MIKKTFSIFALLIFTTFGNIMAQATVNADLVIPTAENSKIMIGSSATYIYLIDEAIGIGANAGIRLSFAQNSTSFQIPVMADGRYYINGDGNGFYPEAMLGLVYSRTKITVLSSSLTASSTNFGFSIGAGYKIDELIDISARYENIMYKNAHSNIIAFRVGYFF